jgi:hypothetical protein
LRIFSSEMLARPIISDLEPDKEAQLIDANRIEEIFIRKSGPGTM